ncbi:MAG: hypothetical protein ACLQVJ_14595, partial [Syntrophobacteraceae bacterium]
FEACSWKPTSKGLPSSPVQLMHDKFSSFSLSLLSCACGALSYVALEGAGYLINILASLSLCTSV